MSPCFASSALGGVPHASHKALPLRVLVDRLAPRRADLARHTRRHRGALALAGRLADELPGLVAEHPCCAYFA